MPRTQIVDCLNCDAQIECEVVAENEDGGDYLDMPEDCPSCGMPLGVGDGDAREDFHSDI